MIEKMTRYAFVLLNGAEEGFLESLQDLGIVDITRSVKAVDANSEEMAARIDSLKSEIKTIRSGRNQHLESLIEKRNSLAKAAEAVAPWGEYDKAKAAELDKAGATLHFYSVSRKQFDDGWANEYPLQVICEGKNTVHFVIAGPVEGFPLAEQGSPKATLAELESQMKAKDNEIDTYRKQLEGRMAEIPGIEAEIRKLSDKLGLYLAGAAGTGAVEGAVTGFEGFAPTSSDKALEESLNALDVLWVREPAKAEDNPPIKLKNNRFSRQFEVLTDMYGRPAYDGFDPTPYISVFFLLFFAMCIGDLGYGLLLVIAGLLLRKVQSFKSLSPLVVYLGIGTVVVGFFFHTFFSIDFAGASWLPDGVKAVMVPAKVAGYDGTMVLALAVGIVHLLLAMIVKTVYATKNKGFLNSLSTWGWTLFWVGLTVIGLVSLAGVLDKSVTKWLIIGLGVVCAIGIFPLNDLHRNPVLNVGSGLWDTYNMATGILGDILSYLRLYALGLAGAMLGFAFNDLAVMARGDGGFGWIPFVLIVVVGHTLNVAMAALGAFVHPLRLNFLEFFKNSDYEGVGVKYNPLSKNQ